MPDPPRTMSPALQSHHRDPRQTGRTAVRHSNVKTSHARTSARTAYHRSHTSSLHPETKTRVTQHTLKPYSSHSHVATPTTGHTSTAAHRSRTRTTEPISTPTSITAEQKSSVPLALKLTPWLLLLLIFLAFLVIYFALALFLAWCLSRQQREEDEGESEQNPAGHHVCVRTSQAMQRNLSPN